MRIVLSIDDSLEKNAARYYEDAKQARRKSEGAREAIERFEFERDKAKASAAKQAAQASIKARKREHWYEKFRWFTSSEGFLCVGGRDASSNEALIKHHTLQTDLVFHTDMAGSPFFILKTEGKTPGQQTIEEAAIATVTFSRAWKRGLATTDVYYVHPEQLSKTAAAGEFISKGAFIVTGKRTYIAATARVAFGVTELGIPVAGPPGAVAAHCPKYVLLRPGEEKVSKVASTIAARLKVHPDDIIRSLPTGTFANPSTDDWKTKDI